MSSFSVDIPGEGSAGMLKVCPQCSDASLGEPSLCESCGADLRAEAIRSGRELGGLLLGKRYRLIRLVGEGAMGWVYEAEQVVLQRRVAVKLMKLSLEADDARVTRFEREARAASRLHHPHIVSVLDFGRARCGLLYLVAEFVRGATLGRLIARGGQLPIARVVSLFHQLLSAVEEAHAQHVIHRDLKPDNVVVESLSSGEDYIKVLDFGVALLTDDPGAKVTQAGWLVGTPAYMAPEQIAGEACTARSDIYSLGCVLYEMLVGALPFEHDSAMALMVRKLNTEPPALRAVAPERGFPAELEQLLAKALARRPEDRFGSVQELRHALMGAVQTMGPVRLACNQCSRARDPETGFCFLHGHQGSVAPVAVAAPEAALSQVRETPVPRRQAPGTAEVQRHATLLEAMRSAGALARPKEREFALRFLLGQRGLLEVVGEAGTGKTTLLDALEKAAAQLGLRVLRTRSDPQAALSPWYPVRRLVGGILGCGMDPSLAELRQGPASQFSMSDKERLGLELLFGHRPPDETVELRTQARWLMNGAFRCLAAAAGGRGQGLCLFADDLQDYDRGSQEFFRALARHATSWDGKLVLASEWRSVPDETTHVVIQLGPLSVEDVATVSALYTPERGPEPPRHYTPTLAQRWAAPSPLCVRQALSLLDEGGRGDGSLAEILGQRLARLPARALEVFEIICLLGDEVPPEWLAALVDEEQLFLALGLLSQRHLLRMDGERRVSPSHPSLARLTLERMDRERRAALHVRAFEVLSAAQASVFVLAQHARSGRLWEQSVRLLEAAGDRAAELLDQETAALHHYRAALHVARWELLQDDQSEPFLLLALKQGDALRATGHKLAAELVYKELLGGAARHPQVQERAKEGLRALQ